ncbi:MAG: hypothetical protein J6W02_02700, partial [Bacteroidaceae bacterium]|nr:hypothetical protein [Bacteroidaceae bacterium]
MERLRGEGTEPPPKEGGTVARRKETGKEEASAKPKLTEKLKTQNERTKRRKNEKTKERKDERT